MIDGGVVKRRNRVGGRGGVVFVNDAGDDADDNVIGIGAGNDSAARFSGKINIFGNGAGWGRGGFSDFDGRAAAADHLVIGGGGGGVAIYDTVAPIVGREVAGGGGGTG